MKTSIWYHTADRQPDKAGYYMGFRTVTLADDTCGVDYFWWNPRGGLTGAGEWRTDATCHSHWANVYYWTPDDPEQWVDSDGPVRNRRPERPDPALESARQELQQAIERYEIVRALSK